MAPSSPEVYTPYLSARSATPTVNASAIANSTDGRKDIINGSLASRASNAANGVVPIGVVPAAAVLLSAYFIPHASQAGSATNFNDLKLLDLGTDGTGTSVLASYTLSAAGQGLSAAQPGLFTSAISAIAAGHEIGLSYVSNGNGIAIVPHAIQVVYRNA